MIQKNGVSYQNDYQKMCDTNKNVTKMGVIIKGGLLYFYTMPLFKPTPTMQH